MNVIDVGAVEAWCAAASASLGTSAREVEWVRSQLRRHALRAPALHVPVRSLAEAEAALRGADVPDWLPAALARGDAVVAFDAGCAAAAELAATVASVADWVRGDPRALDALPRMSVAAAGEAAAAWHAREAVRRVREMARRLRVTERAAHAMLSRRDPGVAALWPDDPDGTVTLHVSPDGIHSVVELRSEAALEREGTLLDHCVATYAERVASGEARVLSVRDASNMPLATAEVAPLRRTVIGARSFLLAYVACDPGVVVQVKGMANGPPPPEAQAVLRDHAAASGLATRGGGGWERQVDVAALARDHLRLEEADGCRPALRQGPRTTLLLEAVARDPGALGPELLAAVAARLAPTRDDVTVTERTTRLKGMDVTVREVTLPCGAFSPLAARVVAAAPDAVTAGLAEVAEHVIALVSASPRVTHRVSTTRGDLAPEVVFAAAGALGRWSAASAASAAAARAHAAAASSHARRALATERDPAERDRLHNAVNVLIPGLLRGDAAVTAAAVRGSARPAPARGSGSGGLARMREAEARAPRP